MSYRLSSMTHHTPLSILSIKGSEVRAVNITGYVSYARLLYIYETLQEQDVFCSLKFQQVFCPTMLMIGVNEWVPCIQQNSTELQIEWFCKEMKIMQENSKNCGSPAFRQGHWAHLYQ